MPPKRSVAQARRSVLREQLAEAEKPACQPVARDDATGALRSDQDDWDCRRPPGKPPRVPLAGRPPRRSREHREVLAPVRREAHPEKTPKMPRGRERGESPSRQKPGWFQSRELDPADFSPELHCHPGPIRPWPRQSQPPRHRRAVRRHESRSGRRQASRHPRHSPGAQHLSGENRKRQIPQPRAAKPPMPRMSAVGAACLRSSRFSDARQKQSPAPRRCAP